MDIVLKKNFRPHPKRKMSIVNFILHQIRGWQEWAGLIWMLKVENVNKEQDVRYFKWIMWKVAATFCILPRNFKKWTDCCRLRINKVDCKGTFTFSLAHNHIVDCSVILFSVCEIQNVRSYTSSTFVINREPLSKFKLMQWKSLLFYNGTEMCMKWVSSLHVLHRWCQY